MVAKSNLPGVTRHSGKSIACDCPPSRFAMSTATEGAPADRFRNEYGKKKKKKKHKDETGLDVLPIGSVQFPVRK
jgi:predicted YcjX-like family ATPase